MPSLIGSVDNTGDLAHINMLKTIRDFASANGWTILRNLDDPVDVGAPYSQTLILKGVGYSGTEEIFVGFTTNESTDNDYYNMSVASMRGFVAGNTFNTQPGISPVNSFCAHNLAIQYWIDVSPQRITGALKVGTPVYETFYVGKFFPYAQPSQYPQPLACIGTLGSAASATRYDSTVAGHSSGFKGGSARFRMFEVGGSWVTPSCYPWGVMNANYDGYAANLIRPVGETTAEYIYSIQPIEIWTQTPANIYGRLEGVYHITGFDNAVENTLTIDGREYIVIQDVFRTGFSDYFAIEMTE